MEFVPQSMAATRSGRTVEGSLGWLLTAGLPFHLRRTGDREP